MTTKRWIQVALLACAGQFFSMAAQSANVLFVSDSQTDTNIPGVLTAAGHTVTTVLDDFQGPDINTVLTGNLAAYNVVVWSATGNGSGNVHSAATATNLSNWVNSGGRLFITGYDSIVSPDDPVLWGLLGGSDGNDVSPSPGAVINVANTLTTGVVDIRGVTPSGGYTDQDSLSGLGGGTVCVVADTANPGACHWTLRTLGSGEIAYVSNGQIGPTSAWASWTDTSAGGAGAYNAALRNFAFGSGAGPVVPLAPASIPTLSEWGMIILSSLLALGTILTLRRQRQ